jgi:hypothetical protein
MLRTITIVLFMFFQSKPVYEILGNEKDNRGLVNQLYIYAPKISDIKTINSIVWGKYKNTGIASFQIFYFDNRKIAINYKRLIFDKSISDRELDKIDTHVIGKFSYVLGKEDFHIGKDANMY